MSSSAEKLDGNDRTSLMNSRTSNYLSELAESFRSKHEIQLLFIITLIAAFLRVYQLGTESIWLDEATTSIIASKSLLEILKATAGDVHPPLHYILVHFFLVLGNSETTLRLPSMIMGVLSVPLIYLLASRMFSSKEGVISAFLLSISQMHIYYSQEARMYSMLLFLSLCSMYFFYIATENNKKNYWVLFSFFTVLNIYTHYFGFFIFPIEILFYLISHVSLSKGDNGRLPFVIKDIHKSKMFAISVLSVILLIIPRIQLFLEQAASRVGGEVTWGIGQSHFITILLSRFTTFSSSPSIIFMLLFVTGIVAIAVYNRKQGLLLSLWFVLPIVVSFYLAGIMPFQPRYLIFVLPAFLILVSRGITAIPQSLISTNQKSKKKSRDRSPESDQNAKKVYLSIAIVLILFLSSFGSLASYYSTPQKNDWREVSSFIEGSTQQGDVIVALPSYMAKPLDYYYDNSSDGTYIRSVGHTQAQLDGIVTNTTPNKVFFVLTGDINAANPEGTVLEWLQKNANVINVINGVYILTPNV